MKGAFLIHILAAMTVAAGSARAGELCSSLRFVAIEPEGQSSAPACDPKVDKLKCQEQSGYTHFGKTRDSRGREAYEIVTAEPSAGAYEDYLLPLERSAALAELNALRIEARTLAHSPSPCEPNYLYIGRRSLFGVGPAFISSTRFVLDGQTDTSNVLVAEDASAPYHIPLSMLSKRNLLAHHYYEIVIAHELAHGLMQDLYGVDEFSRLEHRVVSRDGHFASGVTDPTLALIEGFAEGFEAYLGEKYLSAEEQATPFMDKLMARITDRIGDFEAYGWKGYLFTIPGTIVRTVQTMINVDDFVSDFLKAERQRPIRDNEYVLQGNFNNLSHAYGIPLTNDELDAEALTGYTPESADAVYSKEGVTAHFVYRLLKEGLAPRLFATMLWGKPRDLWELASELRVELDPGELERVADEYKAIFTAAGRAAVSARLKSLIDPDNRRATGFDPERVEQRYRAALARIAVPARLEPPRDYWVEFWNPSILHQKLYGRMDRLNLSTATPGRLDAFLKNVSFPSKLARRKALGALLSAREGLIETGRALTIEDFVAQWRKLPGFDADVAEELTLMRRCYNSHCLSHSLPEE